MPYTRRRMRRNSEQLGCGLHPLVRRSPGDLLDDHERNDVHDDADGRERDGENDFDDGPHKQPAQSSPGVLGRDLRIAQPEELEIPFVNGECSVQRLQSSIARIAHLDLGKPLGCSDLIAHRHI